MTIKWGGPDPEPNGDKPDDPWFPPGEPVLPGDPDPWIPAPNGRTR